MDILLQTLIILAIMALAAIIWDALFLIRKILMRIADAHDDMAIMAAKTARSLEHINRKKGWEVGHE